MKKFAREITSPQTLISLISGLFAVAAGLYAIIVLPVDRDVQSLGIFCFKLLPFIFGAIAIASIKREYCDYLLKSRFAFLFFILGFLIYYCWFVPKIFNAVDGWTYEHGWPQLYYTVLMEIPFIILFLTFVFKIAGASILNTLRLAFSLILIMISGVHDWLYYVVNNEFPILEVWEATHIKVRLGHFPTKYEGYAFIAFHFLLAALLIFIPWDKLKPYKWLAKKLKRPAPQGIRE
jgi:hypothetical protein